MRGGGVLEPKDRFEIAREIIRHEDGLVNNRVTWLLVLQGFLFTAFVNGVALFEKFKDRPTSIWCITAGLVLVAAVGIGSNLTALNVVRIAFQQMHRTKQWWQASGNPNDFPPVAGELGQGWYYWLFSTGRMPYLLVVVWLALAVLLLVGVK
jgi:hypothetical protein